MNDQEPLRPPSLLDRRTPDLRAAVVGFLSAALAHLLLPALLLTSSWLLTVLGLAVPVEERRREVPVRQVVAAELVQLGTRPDPRSMPRRKVPPKVLRRPDGVAVSKRPKTPLPPREREDRPRDAEDSIFENSLQRAKAFAELAEEEPLEGDPEGVEGGAARVAKVGDRYLGKLVIFLHTGWEIPVTVKNTDVLSAVVALGIDEDGTLARMRVNRSSGDDYFDQSLRDHLERLIRDGAAIPEPPPEVAAEFHGVTRPFRFLGKNAR